MKREYRISFRESSTPRLLSILTRSEIRYKSVTLPGSENRLISFDVDDQHPAWPEINALVNLHELPAIPRLAFTENEIREASWCRIRLTNPIAYPFPEDDWLTRRFTYTAYHRESGTYGAQSEPFRIAEEVPEKRKAFMTLYWTHELFARHDIFAKLRQAGMTGLEQMAVLLGNGDDESRRITQLVIRNISSANMLLLPDWPGTRYANGVVRYLPMAEDSLKYPPELLEESKGFLRSSEWFGDGYAAHRELLVSREVVAMILDNKWDGISLEPIVIAK